MPAPLWLTNPNPDGLGAVHKPTSRGKPSECHSRLHKWPRATQNEVHARAGFGKPTNGARRELELAASAAVCTRS